ncbi:MAG: LuxR family transcriptional regulator [Sphingomonadaceae bacterium]|uniref:helix-turn-helix transcriptional regulator n=1 Tax=Thermaurantiacus sp. TaxID=2820283 RepID=UPI00298ED7C6|nr:LuxR family transcriptional regulator [Thermaurantiacus sp.]MCS6986589.1 LuxR family transcriptional regulator [Sphingomonadaceae bacterium]MDW8414150.1 LuxR family transcriptional regulator [Thermaurantiacus sp.]
MRVLLRAAGAFGFDGFDLVGWATDPRARFRLSGGVEGWPTDWRGEPDPVELACRHTLTPFAWDDLPRVADLSPTQRAVLQELRARGLRGWTVPLHIPFEPGGACSFLCAGDRPLPQTSLPAAHHLACFAFEAARRLRRLDAAPPHPRSRGGRLTRRQLECLVLAARGKSDWVTARILGLSPETVHKYLEQAKARFGVSSRTELVVRALHEGELSLADLMDDA